MVQFAITNPAHSSPLDDRDDRDLYPLPISHLSFPTPTIPYHAALYSPSHTPAQAHHHVDAGDVQTGLGTAYNVLNPKGGMIALGVTAFASLTGMYLDPWSALQGAVNQLDDVRTLLEDASRQPGMRRYFPVFIKHCREHLSVFSYELKAKTIRARKRGPLVVRLTFMLPQSSAARKYAQKMSNYLFQLHDDIETSTATAKKWLSEGRAKGSVSKAEQLEYANAISMYKKDRIDEDAGTKAGSGLLSSLIRWSRTEETAPAAVDSDLEANVRGAGEGRSHIEHSGHRLDHGTNDDHDVIEAPDAVELDTYYPAVLTTDVSTGEISLIVPSACTLAGNQGIDGHQPAFEYLQAPGSDASGQSIAGPLRATVTSVIPPDEGVFEGTEDFLNGPEDLAVALNRLFLSQEGHGPTPPTMASDCDV